jgi:hypothetical protein
LAVVGIVMSFLLLAPPANAHQLVQLDSGDTTAKAGPLLVDGTVSFAVRADVKAGETQGFRFRLAEGDRLALQLLIYDEAPENSLAASQLPKVTVVDPRGRRTVLRIRERTEFFEPYSAQAYLYLSRVEREAVPGTYSVTVSGRSSQVVNATVAVGYREVPGEVIR